MNQDALAVNWTADLIASILKERKPETLAWLFAEADRIRRERVGDEVHLRGLVEISSFCVRRCAYCGINAGGAPAERYHLGEAEILACAAKAVEFEYGTLVLQAGEDYGLTRDFIAGVVKKIRATTPLAVTLSLGERPLDDLKAWREAGANRYLLRFETSDPVLYDQIHPARERGWKGRIEILKTLVALGYEAGSGVMIGIPGQSYLTLARDLLLFRELDLDMIGVGPYLPHPKTPLGDGSLKPPIDPGEQVPNTEELTYPVIALARILCPQANIPSTTALATVNKKDGRELGLQRGANIIMPNLTPVAYRARYEIYPAKACVDETADQCRLCLEGRIASIKRIPGKGQGGRKK